MKRKTWGKRISRIGIDLMGSDNAPITLLRATAPLVSSLSSMTELVAIGTPDCKSDAVSLGVPFHSALSVIEMDENPLWALRKKKQSSLAVGLRLLHEKKIDAFVSAGNTGALVSASKMILGMFPNILRPAFLALMPTKKAPVAVLDVGANVQVKAAHLVQFAQLGAGYQMVRGIKTPRIGILNIGSEASKGTSEIRLAYKMLERAPFFAGNIEGKSVFDGDVDVLVTDGFTGNVFLKTAEGIANLILDRLHSHIPTATLGRLADLQHHLHYAEHPGALLCGVQGTVVKCHGYSTPEAFANGIRGAVDFTLSHFVDSFRKLLEKEGPFHYNPMDLG